MRALYDIDLVGFVGQAILMPTKLLLARTYLTTLSSAHRRLFFRPTGADYTCMQPRSTNAGPE
jgi:hypothetical protein